MISSDEGGHPPCLSVAKRAFVFQREVPLCGPGWPLGSSFEG